jgi:Flp pilus assembly protein TadD
MRVGRIPLSATLGGALLALGCASARSPLGEADLLGDLRSRGVDPASVVVPWEITDEMRAWVHAEVPDNLPEGERLDALLTALLDPGRLALQYESGYSGTAREAFETRKANCLAFSSLFVGLAREVGVPAFYLDVDDVETFEKEGDLMVISRHTSAGFDLGGQMKILDFAIPGRQPRYRRLSRLSDKTALALYHSNRGAELLRAGKRRESLDWLQKAVTIDPDLGGAWVNLGVALRRGGDVKGAETVYRKSLEVDPEEASAYQNLAALLRLQGQEAEAGELLVLATRVGGKNPFSYLALGDLSLAHGRLDEARRFYKRALHLYRDNPEPYAALGLVALEGGNRNEARKWLRKAASLDRDNERVRRLDGRLAGTS